MREKLISIVMCVPKAPDSQHLRVFLDGLFRTKST